MHRTILTGVVGLLMALPISAQAIDARLGVDPRVDYAALDRYGPWDDRNYTLTAEDLALLAPDEQEVSEGIPAFFRVQLRREMPDLLREGPAQYPRSALPRFLIEHGGYLYRGRLYRGMRREAGRFVLDVSEGQGVPREAWEASRFLDGESRVTTPSGAAESAIAINPIDPEIVIAGTNGPGSGQRMHYSSDGGETWTQAPSLWVPGGESVCCDPTVVWSSDGALALTATLGFSGSTGVWIYRSADDGATWTDFETITPGDPRREIGSSSSDKEFLHVDLHPTSPHLDNAYLTWHEANVMKFSRSTDFGNTWSSAMSFSSASSERGIGSDITTDKSGNIYYFWPAFNSQKILVKKSTDGGLNFGSTVEVADTEASFIFRIPSMESREVFLYASADTDRTTGPYADSVYVAWTDSTDTTVFDPASNHARIQVAYSRDGGATWSIVTPHETDDSETVDRWHQWLAVAPDGSVHLVFYDTRRDATRTSVDLFHSFSTDGAQTFTTPVRLTTVQSPNISDGFEFGDYNGLDAAALGLLSIFTDNRAEAEGAGDSVDVYSASAAVLEADLTITKDDGETSVAPGGQLTYTIVAGNLGPDPVSTASVGDTFPEALSCTWTCVGSGGASCEAGPVASGIEDTVNLPVGGEATYTAVCDVAADATGTISNTATVTSLVYDPTEANDSATDETTVVVPACSLKDIDLDLSEQTIDLPGQEEEACNSITAGSNYEIVSPGGMTFRTRGFIALEDGFSVGAGASFTAVIDPTVGAASASGE